MLGELDYTSEPLIAFHAESAAGDERCREIIAAVGGRPSAVDLLADERELLPITATPLLVELEEDHGVATDRLLEAVTELARERAVVLRFPRALTDPITAQADRPGIALLCEADPIEAAASLAAALLPQPMLVRERGTDDTSPRLQQLSDEVQRIARMLAQLSSASEDREPADQTIAPLAADDTTPMPSSTAVKAMIRARRLRDQYFDAQLFADPAWDMLLDLLLARIEGRLVAVSSLCIAAAVPPTTALRWIKRLTDEGLFRRTADPHDGRRVFIDLTAKTTRQLASYVNALGRLGLVLP